MKALNPNTGNLESVYVKALDSMPVGTVVEYTGQASDIPVGWEEVSGQNKIQKTSQTTPFGGAVVNTTNNSQSDTYSCKFINELTGKVLWTNPNPLASTFAGQDIVLSETIANYTYYEIIFIAYANAALSLDTFLSTGKLVGERTRLFYVDNYARRRLVSGVSGTNMTFGDGGSCTTYGTDTWGTSNALCVPYQVIGYK